MSIAKVKPRRLFTFGCSFTSYVYETWAELVGLDLQTTFISHGQPGAGNQYIFNMLMQAINQYAIKEDDLVMIEWSSFARDDRRLERGWHTTGSIYAGGYSDDYLRDYVFLEGMAVRDMALIDAARRVLDSASIPYHFMTMTDLTEMWDTEIAIDLNYIHILLERYSQTVKIIKPSFYKVLWDNDLTKRENYTYKLCKVVEYHPYPIEHLQYLQTVFPDHQFKQETIDVAHHSTDQFVSLCNKYKVPYWESTEFKNELDQIKLNMRPVNRSTLLL